MPCSHISSEPLLPPCATLSRMTFPQILTLIDSEIAQLQQARALLTGTPVKLRLGRPVGSGKKKRNLTPEGRAKMGEAVRRRWAKQKEAAK